MKAARLAVGGVALAAAGGAFLLFNRTPAPVAQVVVQAAPTMQTDEVLVASREIPWGTVLTADDLAFQTWPHASVTPTLIRKTDSPNILEDIKGSSVRSNFLVGEPIRRDKLIKGPNAGFLSAILPSGQRAVAITIDGRGSTTAGNFILPNDHVDILVTTREQNDPARATFAGETYKSRVLLKNIKVLAIGPNIQEKNGEKVIGGETATLELTPAQAEVVTLAQRTGQLSLTLRSMMDANEPVPAVEAAPTEKDDGKTLTVVRFGIADQSLKK